jgi:opacity protein-like surface antigen
LRRRAKSAIIRHGYAALGHGGIFVRVAWILLALLAFPAMAEDAALPEAEKTAAEAEKPDEQKPEAGPEMDPKADGAPKAEPDARESDAANTDDRQPGAEPEGIVILEPEEDGERASYISAKSHHYSLKRKAPGATDANLSVESFEIALGVKSKTAHFELGYEQGPEFEAPNGGGKIAINSITLSMYRDFAFGWLVPYIGGGGGVSMIESTENPGEDAKTKRKFEWHAEAGASVELGSSMALVAGYRYSDYDYGCHYCSDDGSAYKTRAHGPFAGIKIGRNF